MSKLLSAIGFSLILASTAATAGPSVKPDGKDQEKKYCLTFEADTGSHLTRTECRTKKEWRALGVDVDQLSSKEGNSGDLA
jgi:hypothetical protein